MWIKKLLRSFRNAGRGIAQAAREERNLRIHLTAVCYVAAAGLLAELDGTQWAAMLVCCGAVIGAELVNTAIERLCDALHPAHSPKIGMAKDMAAAAVLVLAVCAVAIAVAIFAPWVLGGGLLAAMRGNEVLLPAFLVSLIPAILWIRGRKEWKLKNQA